MVPISGPLSASLQADIRKALEQHMQEAGLSQKDVAEAIGQTPTYVNNLLNSSASLPEAARDRMWRDINNWLEREARARESSRSAGFVRHKVAERLIALAERLTERSDMAIAYGPAGVGKSVTVEAIIAEIPTAIAFRAGYDSRTPNKLLAQLWRIIARRTRRPYNCTLDDLADKLRMPASVSSRSVLIVDQAHELTDRCVALLAELHDRSGCSVILVGTIDLATRTATDADPHFGQISSRIGLRINLAPEVVNGLSGGGRALAGALFTVGDVRKMFHRGKLKFHPKALALLARVANSQRGTLRRVGRLVFWAEKAALQDGADLVELRHIELAAQAVEREFALPREEEDVEPSREAATA